MDIMVSKEEIKLIVEEISGVERIEEPITVGVPFPEGVLKDENTLSLFDAKGNPVPFQAEALKRWSDRSVKWTLLDFMVDCPANASVNYSLKFKEMFPQVNMNNKIEINNNGLYLTVDTGMAAFAIDKKIFLPFNSVTISGVELIDTQKCYTVLKDEAHEDVIPVIKKIDIETRGLLRSTVKAEGEFESKDGKVFSGFFARLSFYAGKSMVKIDFTIRNPKAAKHSGGLWDLGDKGSIYFDDFSLCLALSTKQDTSIFWKTQLTQEQKRLDGKRIEIYQDSSGGDNWDSPNHVNRYGKVMNSFRGYRVSSDSLLEEGYRAAPTVAVSSGEKRIAATIQRFWQNFPKAIEAKSNSLILRLFPKQYNDLFELQGGEQKTHTIFLEFGPDINKPMSLDWVQEPLVARQSPEWYAKGMAIGYMSPKDKDKNPDYQRLVDSAVRGDNTFFDRREKVDEYGWRNFGEIFADHEVVAYKGSSSPFVSHYNNQYDVIYGCMLQFCRTGDLKWYHLGADLARHVIDIDIYHTNKDRPGFSGGHFWHTDHFMHTETSTHRSFSKRNAEINGIKSYGGGPSSEHCYTTGLCIYFFLSGDVAAKEAVIELADWILNADKVERSLCGVLRKVKQTASSILNEYSNAPGRGEANSINTLLDAFKLTDDRKYLLKAEGIIKKFISPSDDIDRLNKQKIEKRWFYLIFLQSIGKYLDVKDSINERDEMFDYAREGLFHHAQWMLENEVPYKQLFHIVEIPSSTWPAQDIRKSVIFDYVYKYADGPFKQAAKEKSEFFYNTSISDILSFDDESKTFVRPLAILMNYGVMHTYFQNIQ